MTISETQDLAERMRSAGFTSLDIGKAFDNGPAEDRDGSLMQLMKLGGIWEEFAHRARLKNESGEWMDNDTIKLRWYSNRRDAVMAALARLEDDSDDA